MKSYKQQSWPLMPKPIPPPPNPPPKKVHETTMQTPLSSDHPMMKAWNEFCETDEFKNALRWAVETEYDDGRPIGAIYREQHAKGAMFLAFTKGLEHQQQP